MSLLYLFCLIGFIGGFLFLFITITIPVFILQRLKKFFLGNHEYVIAFVVVILIVAFGWAALFWPILLITMLFEEQLDANRSFYAPNILLSYVFGAVMSLVYVRMTKK